MTDQTEPVSFRVGTLTYTVKSLGALFFWLLWGDLCFTLMETVVPSILPLRLKALDASNTTIGLIMITLPSLINAVANPIISFRSDRYRGKLGRRIPFIIATLPWLVVSIIGFGYADKLRALLLASFPHSPMLSPHATEIWIIGVFVVSFYFFNTFVNSVFWYLFNDVVPEHLLARFMSLFRLVSILSVALYNFFIFRYAGAHHAVILTGASLVYLFGFGSMCFMVKEGKYPPPPPLVGNKTGVVEYVRTFVNESLTLRHYWLVFLTSCFTALLWAMGAFTLFFFEATGLNLAQIGRINGMVAIVGGITIPISGWLADRYHPIRIVLLGNVLNTCLAIPVSLVWLFWRPEAPVAFIGWIVINVVINAPVTQLTAVFDPPLFMRIFPRSRYGQFCSANAALRSLTLILGGIVAGMFFDFAGRFMPKAHVYFLSPVWSFTFSIPLLICSILLFKSWKQYGGDENYVPPVPGESLEQRLHEELVEEAEAPEPDVVQ